MKAKAATLLVCLALMASLAAGSAASSAPGEVSYDSAVPGTITTAAPTLCDEMNPNLPSVKDICDASSNHCEALANSNVAPHAQSCDSFCENHGMACKAAFGEIHGGLFVSNKCPAHSQRVETMCSTKSTTALVCRCERPRECKCVGGDAVSHSECPSSGAHRCATCDQPHFGVQTAANGDKICKQNVCRCNNGAPATTGCSADGAHMCKPTGCDAGYVYRSNSYTCMPATLCDKLRPDIKGALDICEQTKRVCEGLVDSHLHPHGGSCESYCSNHGMRCVNAWDDTFKGIKKAAAMRQCPTDLADRTHIGCSMQHHNDLVCRCEAKCTCDNGAAATGAACTEQGAHVCATCTEGYGRNAATGRCEPCTAATVAPSAAAATRRLATVHWPTFSDANDASACQPVAAACGVGEYEKAPPTASSDRVCASHKLCLDNQYIVQDPTKTSDRVCMGLRACGTDEWEQTPPTTTTIGGVQQFSTNRVCTPHSTCTAEQWERSPGTSSSDRDCVDLTVCTSSQREIQGALASRDRKCEECPHCNHRGSVVVQNNVCSCACPAGREFEMSPPSMVKTWSEARGYCRSIGRDLVSVHSRADRVEIERLVTHDGNMRDVWLGINDIKHEGHWVNPDGSVADTNFAAGQPDNSDNEDCVHARGDAFMADLSCAKKLPFICGPHSSTEGHGGGWAGDRCEVCPANRWHCQWFNNPNLAGTPIHEECRASAPSPSKIGYTAIQGADWGGRGPAQLDGQQDNFSVRCHVASFDLQSGTYTLKTEADDGSRIMVDGETVLDKWNVAGNFAASPMSLSGSTSLTYEMKELSGHAKMSMIWDFVCPSGHWQRQSDLACRPLTVCNSEKEYQSAAPTSTSDRVCAALTQCDSEKYETLAATATSDRSCATLTQCTSTQWEKTAPSIKAWVHQRKKSGTCSRALTTAQECEAAARILMLPDTTATADGHIAGVYYDPSGCYYENRKLQFNAHNKNTGSCSRQDECLCMEPLYNGDRTCATHTSCEADEFENAKPNMKYELRSAGTCSDPVTSLEECTAAGAQLGLGKSAAELDGQRSKSYDPIGCYRENGVLKFNGFIEGGIIVTGTSTGRCTHGDTCVCRRHHISDRQCLKHRKCTDFEFETAPATGTSNRVCESHRTCADGLEFESKAPTYTSNRECTPIRTCDSSSQFESKAPTGTSNRVCTAHREPCAIDEYESLAPGEFNNRQCTALTTCTDGEYQFTAPSGYSDKIFVFGGSGIGTECSGNGQKDDQGKCRCDAYHSGTDCSYRMYFTSNRVCKPISACDFTHQWQESAPTSSSDRVCQPLTTCAQDAWEKAPPTQTSDRVCASHSECDTDQWEKEPSTPTSDRVCMPVRTCNYDAEFEKVPPTTTSNRVCESLTFCLQSEWETMAKTTTSNRACATCPKGFKCDGGSTTYDCNIAADGSRMYQDEEGQTTCKPCGQCGAGHVRQGCGNELPGTCHQCAAGSVKTCANAQIDTEAPDIITDIQAEDGELAGGAVAEAKGQGFEGEGYVNFVSQTGESATWTYNAQAEGTVTLKFRYSLNADATHDMKVAIDHVTINNAYNADITFVHSGSSSGWHEQTIQVAVKAGANTLRLETKTESGPNLDRIRVIEPAPPRCVEHTCRECSSGHFELARRHCALCKSGRYSGAAATSCTSCGLGSYQPLPGRNSCMTCMGFTTKPGPSLVAHTTMAGHTSCHAHTTCTATQYESTSPTKTSNRICTDHSTCDFASQWMQRDGSATLDRVCTDLVNCVPGWYEKTGPTKTSDRICDQCDVGTFSAGTNAQSCTTCSAADGMYQDWRAQSACKACSARADTCLKGEELLGCGGDGPGACELCQQGHFKLLAGAGECSGCGAGQHQSQLGQDHCDACTGPDFFQASPNQATCSACDYVCPAGKFKPKVGNDACGGSQAGACIACPAGTYKSALGDGSCVPCEAGTYSKPAANAQVGATSCKTCGVGTYATSAGSDSCEGCEPCAAGFKRHDCRLGSAGSCVACVSGKYKEEQGTWSTQCKACLPGRFGNEMVGTYHSGAARIVHDTAAHCEDCAKGTYNAEWGKTECTACGHCVAGEYRTGCGDATTIEGVSYTGTSAGSCAECEAGTHKDGTHSWDTLCTNCVAGKFGSNNDRTSASAHCEDCPQGKYSLGAGWSECDTCAHCQPGTYLDSCGGSNDGQCKQCPHGRHNVAQTSWEWTLGSAGPCTKCAKGTFGDDAAGSRASTAHCAACPGGKFQPGEGASECKACALCKPGFFSLGCGNAEPGACNACDAGTFKDTGSEANPGVWNDQCKDCVAGEFSATASASCDDCATGQYQLNPGQPACKACGTCSEGRQREDCSLASAGTCKACPTGRVKASVGTWNTLCTACSKGRFSSDPALVAVEQRTCELCPVGKYQDKSEQGSCKSCQGCGKGEFRAVCAEQEQRVCEPCAKGQFKDTLAAQGPWDRTCTLCPAGKHRDAVKGESCDTCAEGFFQPASGKAICDRCAACPAGEIRVACGGAANPTSQGHCVKCPHGHFKPASDTSPEATCRACPVGTFALLEAQASCEACGAGKYQSQTGQSWCDSCTTCPTGRFRSTCGGAEGGECEQCAPGQFKNGFGSSWDATCSDCAPGRYAMHSGSSACKNCATGRYAQRAGQGSCNACERCGAGLFRDGCGDINGGQCSACLAGKYKLGSGQTWAAKCDTCPAGKHSGAGQQKCTACSGPSFYQDEASQEHCKTCESCSSGKSRETCGGVTAGSCNDCEQGSWKNNAVHGVGSAVKCADCVPGKYGDSSVTKTSGSHCRDCAPGQFSEALGAKTCDNCASCPAGTQRESCGSASAGTCAKCAAGKFKDSTGSAATRCLVCPTGKYQPREGQDHCVTCMTCAAGLWREGCQGLSSGVCRQCDEGKFKADSGANYLATCEDCAAGTYAQTKGQSRCVACAKGYYQTSTTASHCLQCDTCGGGQYRTGCGGDTAGDCIDCAAGKVKYSDGANYEAKCDACSHGQYQDESGQKTCKSCTSCAAGSHNTKCGGSTPGACKGCPAGQFKHEEGSWNARCEECAPGKFTAPAMPKLMCETCASGTYQPLYGQPGCVGCSTCPGGAEREKCGAPHDATSGGRCVACNDGAYKVGSQDWDTRCMTCPAGRYGHAAFSKAGEQHCRDCPTGKFQLITAQTSCDHCATCPAGKHRVGCGAGSAGTCETCPTGSWKDGHHLWHTGCTLCGVGRFGTGSQTSIYHCVNCPTGQMQHYPGAPECVECKAGKYQHFTGQTTCLTCPGGKFTANDGTATCTDCALGRFQLDDSKTLCNACPAGKYADEKAEQECKTCGAGWYSSNDASHECTMCAPGAAQPHANKVDCPWCPKGRFQGSSKGTTCNECSAGEFASEAGSSACTACPSGTYQRNREQDHCVQCEPGRVIADTSTDRSDCRPCAAGTFRIEAGGTECTKCAAGTFGQAGALGESSSEYCKVCGAGRYQPSEGSTACVNCLPGRYGKNTEHTATVRDDHCLVCEAGYYETLPGQTECRKCGRKDNLRIWHSARGATACHTVPVDCKPSDWGSWGTCTKSCGEGRQTRTRTKVKQVDDTGVCGLENEADCYEAWGGGKACSQFSWSETQTCNAHDCAVDCEVSAWSSWSGCTKTCGGGSSTRTRSVVVPTENGGKACPELSEQSQCNKDVPCDIWKLPECALEHVQCEIREHKVNDKPAIMGAYSQSGELYYVDMACRNEKPDTEASNLQCKVDKPDDFVDCGWAEHKKWTTTSEINLHSLWATTNKPPAHHPHHRNVHVSSTGREKRVFSHMRQGHFTSVDQTCINNQDCGLRDVGHCHRCDTKQECKDLGFSSTLFVKNHRKYMHLTRFDAKTGQRKQVNYHCKRVGDSGCKCHCNGHLPCVAKKGKMLANAALHANAYPQVPTMQDCCNMCTNHPDCESWEYSDSKICVLKSGVPQFVDVPADVPAQIWSGCRAGTQC